MEILKQVVLVTGNETRRIYEENPDTSFEDFWEKIHSFRDNHNEKISCGCGRSTVGIEKFNERVKDEVEKAFEEQRKRDSKKSLDWKPVTSHLERIVGIATQGPPCYDCAIKQLEEFEKVGYDQ